MNVLNTFIAILAFFGISLLATAADKPNVILILADDLGYADLSVQGCKQFKTPHIDSIFNNGVRFTQGYVSNSVCAPSRAGLLTGRSGSRFGFEANLPKASEKPGSTIGLDPNQTTIADVMKGAGYETYAIGKWHLGYNVEKFHPNTRGFDHFFGLLGGSRSYWPLEKSDKGHGLQEDGTYVNEKAMDKFYVTDLLTDKAIGYIKKQHRETPEKPFFMYLSYTAPHAPMHAPEEVMKRVPPDIKSPKRRIYAGMVMSMDDNVGRLLRCLDKLKLTENTLIVFLSDNGGPLEHNGSYNGSLKGSKGTLYEGGTRVPFAIQWKGTIKPDQVRKSAVTSLDLLPTFAAAATQKTGVDSDGVNLLPWLTDEIKELPTRTFYWRRGNMTVKALIEGEYKYHVRGDKVMLVNLKNDLGEKVNLAESEPEVLTRLKNEYEEWENSVPKAAFKSDWKPPKKKKK